MKQLIGLIRLGALTAFAVALYSAQRRIPATQTTHNHHSKKPDRQAGPEGELVLLDMDGTVIAREINLAPQQPLDEESETNGLLNKLVYFRSRQQNHGRTVEIN